VPLPSLGRTAERVAKWLSYSAVSKRSQVRARLPYQTATKSTLICFGRHCLPSLLIVCHDDIVTQERERTSKSTTCNHILLSLANCLSRVWVLVSSASECIQCSRPLQFTIRQNIQHPYVCFAVKLVLWLLLWSWFISCGFGAVFFVVSLICFVWINTGTKPREPGVPSAYSVFNQNCERIEGTFTAEQFENELRHGILSIPWCGSWFCLLWQQCAPFMMWIAWQCWVHSLLVKFGRIWY